MIFESLSIIFIILVLALVFLRVRKREYFFLVLPLGILPFMQVISSPLGSFISSFLPARIISIQICLIFIALIVESILIGLLSGALKSKLQKTYYLLICGGFSLVLAMVYILFALKSFGV